MLPKSIRPLGKLYAERDPLTVQTAVETELTDNLATNRDRSILLVLGSKGAGKSALLNVLQLRKKEKFAAIDGVGFHQLPWLQLVPERLKLEPSATRMQWMRDKWRLMFVIHLLQLIFFRSETHPIADAGVRKRL